MKGVILAGGTGTRLRPYTLIANKHTAPINGSPMILYPLKTLIGGGIRDILVITGRPSQEHGEQIMQLLGSGKRLNEVYGIPTDMEVDITYRVQDEAGGIAQAIGMAENFVDGERFATILGDNIFGDNIGHYAERFERGGHEAMVFLKKVDDPWRFGVAEIKDGRLAGIEEKPERPKSGYAVTGLYMYDGSSAFDIIKELKPSARGELEVTDINNAYLGRGTMGFEVLNGFWSDAGTPGSIRRADEYLRSVE